MNDGESATETSLMFSTFSTSTYRRCGRRAKLAALNVAPYLPLSLPFLSVSSQARCYLLHYYALNAWDAKEEIYKISIRCPSSRSTAFGAVRLDSGDAFSELTLEFTRVYIITCGYFQLNFLHRPLFLLFPSRRRKKEDGWTVQKVQPIKTDL